MSTTKLIHEMKCRGNFASDFTKISKATLKYNFFLKNLDVPHV